MVVRKVTLPRLVLSVVFLGFLIGFGLAWAIHTRINSPAGGGEWIIEYESDPKRIELLGGDVVTLEGPGDKAYISVNPPIPPTILYSKLEELKGGECVTDYDGGRWCPHFNYPDDELGERKLYSVFKWGE